MSARIKIPKEKTRYRIDEVRNPGGSIAWKVSGSFKGKKTRKQFNRRQDAEAFRADMEAKVAGISMEDRLLRTHLSASQQAEAEAAIRLANGRNLVELVSKQLEWERMGESKKVSHEKALRFFDVHFRAEVDEISLSDAIEEFLTKRRDSQVAEKTIANYSFSLKRLRETSTADRVSQVTLQEVEEVLKGFQTISSKRSIRTDVNAFFNWARNRRYVLENPCDRLDRLPKNDNRIRILRLEHSVNLLRAAIDFQEAKMVPSLAILLFAGLRPSEVAGLTPADFRESGIRVTEGKMARETNRVVPVPSVLQEWLALYPYVGRPEGYAYGMKRLKELSGTKVQWCQNILRHTSISFQWGRDKDMGLVEKHNGTSKSMMNRHYLEVIEDPKEIETFWNLTPETVKAMRPDAPAGAKRPKKVNWPDDPTLKMMIESMSMVAVAKALGVSDTAVRKRAIKRGLMPE